MGYAQEKDTRLLCGFAARKAQSRLRMSTLCKHCVRPLEYPLPARIVELAQAVATAAPVTPRAKRAVIGYPDASLVPAIPFYDTLLRAQKELSSPDPTNGVWLPGEDPLA